MATHGRDSQTGIEIAAKPESRAPLGIHANWWPSDACAKASGPSRSVFPTSNIAGHGRLGRPRTARSGSTWGAAGAITKGIWERSHGTVGTVVGLDCAAANRSFLSPVAREVSPCTRRTASQFIHHDFNSGSGSFPKGNSTTPCPGCRSRMPSLRRSHGRMDLRGLRPTT